MSRYIDIEPIENAAEEYGYLIVSIALIKAQPTADVVEVVRCKNCKHSYYDSELEKYWCTNYSGSIEKSADGFCDDGKPRSE